MCDPGSLCHNTPDPGHGSEEMERESISKREHAFLISPLGEPSQDDHLKAATDSGQHISGKILQVHRDPKLVAEPSGTFPLLRYIYNKKGAAFLAKNALGRSCGLPTRRMFQENGRIYQGQGIDSYLLPCDEMEQDRLDFMHALVMKALWPARLSHIPHAFNGRLLDLGCGTGIWAIEIAEAYPNAYVLGVDISATQPDLHPPNCAFTVPFDYERPWLIDDGQWDVIHMRMGCGSVTNWPRLYAKILDHLRCDAWFEQVEVNFEPRCHGRPLKKGPLSFWYQSLKSATRLSKREIAHSPVQTLQWLRKAGFSDVRYREVVLPLKRKKQPDYDGVAAQWCRTAFTDSIQPLCMAPFTRVHGWTHKKIKSVVDAALAEALDPNMDLFYTLHIYRARKS
ncbi:hypothetical protein CBS147347_11413 [Aspergillus niger]|nr:hypothetical protein CBS147347_11413 [Aspergillus niger]